MSKSLPWILVAALVVSLVFACQELLDTEKNLTNERNAIQRQADSLRTVLDQREAQLKTGDSIRAAMKAELDSARLVRQPLNTVIDDFTKAAFNAGLDSMQRIHWTDPE